MAKKTPKKSAPKKRAAAASKKPAARKPAKKTAKPARAAKAPVKKAKAIAKRGKALAKAATRKLTKAVAAKKKKPAKLKATSKLSASKRAPLRKTAPAKKTAAKKPAAKPAPAKPAAKASAPAHVFCWAELATHDVAAAKAFYTQIFPWEMSDMPMPDGSVYSMATIDGGPVGAIFTMHGEMKAHGAPPQWNVYVSTPNVDASARRIAELGGKVLAAPFDVMDVGRMAVAEDPTGAVFSLWQAGNHKGFAYADGRPGTFCWGELMSSNTELARVFYGKLLGWTGQQVFTNDPNDPYTVLSSGEYQVAGVHPLPDHLKAMGVPSNWIMYWVVSNCDATTDQARELGATVLLEPMSVPEVGRMAVLHDPQGATFAILQPG
jgi:predicted enzyme related to lactoylglutathione lyase